MSVYAKPGTEGSVMSFESRYDNWIGGKWVPPVKGQYFENPSPVDGKTFCEVARSTAEDIDLALDAAWAAAPAWGKTSVAERAVILNKIADRIEANLEKIAVAETWDNGKAVRETLAADIPLAVDHFRYFAGVVRAQEGGISEIDSDTVAYHFHEPLGVVGQIIPWNFPILMAVWKLAPALAAGNCVVLKPAEQTPASILFLFSIIGDLLPDGVVNIVNGFGVEAGKPLASSNRIRKIAFTGETTTGRLIMQYASENLIPVTLELGGKSPVIIHETFPIVDAAERISFGKCWNAGQTCVAPDYLLLPPGKTQEFVSAFTAQVSKMYPTMLNNPDYTSIINDKQYNRIQSYLDDARAQGAKIIEINPAVLQPHAIGMRLEPFARLVGLGAVSEVAAHGERHAQDGVARLQHRGVHRLIGLRAGMGLQSRD